ncbi:MAG: serine/threonine-protein kinase [Kofleriaceae bacterium]
MSAPPSLADSFERLLAEPADAIAAPLTAGTVVADRYEVIERIGAGAMGMVYLAKDRDLERKIALKLHKKRAGTEQLRREALAMARLAHPNVVTVFEVGEHEGRTFVAMEYVAGTTLRGWLSAQRHTPNEIVDMLVSAGEGLIAAHDAKLVHRDFKPENVLIGSDGRARVSDFGLARESGHEVGVVGGGIGAATGVAGTPAYMAPEQALGISVDARADQYAFCGVAWEALVGPWPRDDKPTKHPRIRRVLERGLSKDPSARYPTMRALLSALRGARSRGHIVAGSIAVALLLVATAVAFAWPKRAIVDTSCDTAGIEMTTFALDVPARLARTQRPVVVELVRERLDRYRASFIATTKKVCTHGRVDGTWSSDLYQHGLDCLELRRRTLTILFSNADRLTAPELINRVVRLEDDTTCGDATILASRPALPADRSLVDEIIRVRSEMEASLFDYGSNRKQRMKDALSAAEASRAKDDPMVAARIEYMRGAVAREAGDLKTAEAQMTKAYFAARAIDDPDLALGAVSNLIVSMSTRVGEPALANWLANGEADAQRSRTRAPRAAARLFVVAAATNDAFGDPEKAMASVKEAFPLLGDTPSRSLADALMIRGSAYISLGQPELAYADYVRAVEMFDSLYGPDHPVLAPIKLTVSAAMAALNRNADAHRYAVQGEAILERNPGTVTAHDLAVMKLDIGVSYIDAGEYAKARKLLAEAREQTLAVLGPDHPDLALIDSNVAAISIEEKDYATALRLGREALALMERTTPEPHEDRGELLQYIAEAARNLGDIDAAISSAVASAAEYSDGDDRKTTSLVLAARAANDGSRSARALELIDKARALPAGTDPEVKVQLEVEYARALIGRAKLR